MPGPPHGTHPCPRPAAASHLEGHLPRPGPCHRRLPADNAVVATDDRCDGGHAAVCGAQAAVGRWLRPPRHRVPSPPLPPAPAPSPPRQAPRPHSLSGTAARAKPASARQLNTHSRAIAGCEDRPARHPVALICTPGHLPASAGLATAALGDSVTPAMVPPAHCQLRGVPGTDTSE